MNDIVAVVNVRYSFHPELDRGLYRHEEGEEERTVGKDVREATLQEVKYGDCLSHYCSLDELEQHDFRPSMSQRTMLEEQVCQSIQVIHLDVGACQHI